MNFFLFFFLSFIQLYYPIQYSGIIQITIKQDPTLIKNDLDTIVRYENARERSIQSVPTITHVDSSQSRNGFALYQPQDNTIETIHYQIAKKLVETHMHGESGIVAHYRGYTASSNNDGIIIFPRLDNENNIPIIITKRIYPIILHGHIPDHFIIEDITSSRGYRAFYNQINSDTGKWNVVEERALIENKIIPFPAIIIFGDSHDIYFDMNPYAIDNSVNIILPPLYIRENTNMNIYSNMALQTLHYFKALHSKTIKVTIDDQLHEGFILK